MRKGKVYRAKLRTLYDISRFTRLLNEQRAGFITADWRWLVAGIEKEFFTSVSLAATKRKACRAS